ncbi:MAG: hypothetical protein ACFFDU_01005 [Candidatus Thorarchaeota archaeon]
MSSPLIKSQTSTIPGLPDHTFRLVKVIETRKDKNKQDVHYLTVFMETLIEGRVTRKKMASLALSADQSDAPTLSWQAYMEQDF